MSVSARLRLTVGLAAVGTRVIVPVSRYCALVRFDDWNGRNSNCGNLVAIRCVTRRSNSSVVSVCCPVIMSSIGSRTMLRLGADEPLLDRVDSIFERNDGSLPVCATRLSVASAAAFSKVCGSFDGVQAAISAAAAEGDQGGGETAGERPDDGVHLHSLLK